ncbi:putative COP9 subunit 3 [Talaromyces proteolyticus]|uniref:COP9 subunit 3 n=1 Tax=Talaromyces proteolyticus TaxID=1131652 RepID=A0AAD4L137_9EURO|nr:putative COP9 subunit 3 [Talaromyces proteolyticus]KAH8704691.1 putative COP9 subunit 3 [Talaromyces proteolyticus]
MMDILPLLLSFPSQAAAAASHDDYNVQARDFLANVNERLPIYIDGSANNTNDLLEKINPSTHSLSYLLVLHFHLKTLEKTPNDNVSTETRPGSVFWTRSTMFLRTFEPNQIKFAGSEWYRLMGFIATTAEMENKPLLAVRPIRDAIIRLDPTCSSFTPTHVLLSRACLLAKAYTLALPILDQTIYNFSTTVNNFHQKSLQNESDIDIVSDLHSSGAFPKTTHTDHLQYFLYGAMIYMALKKWSKARHFLSIVVSSPATNSVSLIMVEAYKKWVLVNLLEKGTSISLPKVTAPVATKVYKALARPYDAFASAFVSGDWEKLRAEAEFGQSIWRMDKNTGLVQQALLAFRKQSVLRLSATFAAVTTIDVARRALSNMIDINATEQYILSLAIQQQIFASLLHLTGEQESSIIRFSSSRNKQSTEQETYLDSHLLFQQRKLESLVQHIQASDRKLELGREYVDYLRRGQRHNDSMSKDGVQSSRMKGQDIDIDEDMMGDMH